MKFKKITSAITCAAMLFTPSIYAGLNEDISNVCETLAGISISIPNMAAVDAEVLSTGACGNSLTWTLYKGNILEISGQGEMYSSYTAAKNYPWHQKRDAIKQIIIGDEVTSIGDYAFNECIKVTSVTLGKNVKTLGTAAFALCEKLESVTLNENLETMSGSAFDNCISLKSVVFPDTLVNISGPYFCGCMSLTSITVKENNPVYSSDSHGVLYNKDKTTLIRYPAQGQKTDYTVPESVSKIERYAFWDSTTLSSIIIPDTVKVIGEYAFSCCTALESVTLGRGITEIDEYIFYGCSALPEITIPSTVTSIGVHAFENCKSLRGISIPDSVTKISAWSFGNCMAMTSLTLGRGIKTIPMRAFADCTSLVNVKMENTVEIIDEGAFEYCESLEYIDIPNSVTSIGNEAFKYCTALKSFTLPDSVTHIGSGLFYTCTSLETVTLGEGIETISYETFYECSSLKNVNLGNNIKTIDTMAFAMCSQLESFYIPDGVDTINAYAFHNCTNLKKIDVSRNNKYFSGDEHGVLFNKYRDTLILYPMGKTETSYTVPYTVYDISDNAFYGCETLKTVILGENVEVIGSWAFGYCTNLEQIEIGEWVFDINEFAFYGCDSLSDVYFIGSENVWNKIDLKDGNEHILSASLHCESSVPPFVEAPEAPEFTDESRYKLNEKNETVIIKPSSKNGESLNAFMKNITTAPEFIQVTDAYGNVKTSVARLTTGYNLQLLDSNTKITKTYTIIILGDTDRNGRYTFADVSGVQTAVITKPSKDTFEFAEADIDGNGRLAFTDPSALQAFLANEMW